MDLDQRIAQWENMAQSDPDNAMGWFSLGSAYKEAGRFEEAVDALGKAIDRDAGLSRAYQIRSQVLISLERNDEAADVLTKGYVIAAERGDVMPQRAMGSLLEKIGKPVPEVAKKETETDATLPEDAIICRRTGKPGNRIDRLPLRGPLAEFIKANYSAETWNEWIHMGTKVINELRLDLSRDDHGAVYDQNMMEWLGITNEDLQA